MTHAIQFTKGTDTGNHIVRCACGWCFASTYRAVRERGHVHMTIFVHERHAWNDPKREAEMPLFVTAQSLPSKRSTAASRHSGLPSPIIAGDFR